MQRENEKECLEYILKILNSILKNIVHSKIENIALKKLILKTNFLILNESWKYSTHKKKEIEIDFKQPPYVYDYLSNVNFMFFYRNLFRVAQERLEFVS